jgi:hypothetical protein
LRLYFLPVLNVFRACTPQALFDIIGDGTTTVRAGGLVVAAGATENIQDTTDATSSATGSLITAGGIGVAKSVQVG